MELCELIFDHLGLRDEAHRRCKKDGLVGVSFKSIQWRSLRFEVHGQMGEGDMMLVSYKAASVCWQGSSHKRNDPFELQPSDLIFNPSHDTLTLVFVVSSVYVGNVRPYLAHAFAQDSPADHLCAREDVGVYLYRREIFFNPSAERRPRTSRHNVAWSCGSLLRDSSKKTGRFKRRSIP